jgi:hypothetical protein
VTPAARRRGAVAVPHRRGGRQDGRNRPVIDENSMAFFLFRFKLGNTEDLSPPII